MHYISSCGTGRIARLMLADVSGHGGDAAGVASKLRRVMQRYMNHIEPQALAKRLNRDIGDAVGDTGRFATALVLTFFSPDGGLSLCNAGHPPPMLYRRASGRWSPIVQPDTQERIANLPLGVLDSVGYEGRELTLEPGDVVLAYTDCLIEASRCDEAGRPDGPMLDISGLRDTLNALPIASDPQAGPRVVVDALLDRLSREKYVLDDDLTVVALMCTERSAGRGTASRMMGVVRALRMMAGAIVGRSPAPWPEFSMANLIGGLWPGYRRRPRG